MGGLRREGSLQVLGPEDLRLGGYYLVCILRVEPLSHLRRCLCRWQEPGRRNPDNGVVPSISDFLPCVSSGYRELIRKSWQPII